MRRIRFATIADVFSAHPDLPGRDAMVAGETPLDFLARRTRSGQPGVAVEVWPFVLSRRAAIWWAWRAAWSCQPPGAGDRDPDGGLRSWLAAAAWVCHPDEASLAEAVALAGSADPARPVTWVLKAVQWSGGPMEPDMAVPVPPPQDLAARAAGVAVLMAAARSGAGRVEALARASRLAGAMAVDAGDIGTQARSVLASLRAGEAGS